MHPHEVGPPALSKFSTRWFAFLVPVTQRGVGDDRPVYRDGLHGDRVMALAPPMCADLDPPRPLSHRPK